MVCIIEKIFLNNNHVHLEHANQFEKQEQFYCTIIFLIQINLDKLEAGK